MSGVIAVHVGAGYHAEKRRASYKEVCRKSCREAVKLLQKNSSAVDAVSAAVSVLEDCPLTNAGMGSSLTINGTVECDAAVMDSSSLEFGSVGAIYGLKNPVKVAQAILNQRTGGLLHCGRIPPCTLVGKGAVEWARGHGFSVVDSSLMVTEQSRAAHAKCSSLLNTGTAHSSRGSSVTLSENVLDTVGAVAVDSKGNVASAVSSGGLMMKFSGRIGQAAVYGAGCWAEGNLLDSNVAIGVSISGMGEYLVKTLLAKECFEALRNSENCTSAAVLPDVLRTKFLESPYLKSVDVKHAGALVVVNYPEENTSEVMWAHTTRTFLLGYMSVHDHKPHCVVSERTGEGLQSKAGIVSSGRKISHR